MLVIGGIVDFARYLLRAMRNVLDPIIGKNFIERCSLAGIYLEHETNNIPAFPG